MSMISSAGIFEALTHYQLLGYTLLDVPMCVDQSTSRITKPVQFEDHFHTDKVYVGSAEQSFIQLHKDQKLEDGRYMAITPCVRPEKVVDDLHYEVFLKIELISVGAQEVRRLTADAQSFFTKHFDVRRVETNESIDSCDLVSVVDEVEVGSYGIRQMVDGTFYTYGTGIAEPRFSVVRAKSRVEL